VAELISESPAEPMSEWAAELIPENPADLISESAADLCRIPHSRLTVDAGRPSMRAIERSDRPAARLREISSRSVKVSASRDRRRAGGLIPPLGERWLKTHELGLPITRPIALSPSPLRQRSHSSALCAAVNPTR
jgi:hypothetical protein